MTGRIARVHTARSFQRKQADQLQAVTRHLQVIEDGGPSVYARLLPLLSDALGLEKVMAYGVEPHEETHRLTFAESIGFRPGVVERECGALVSGSSRAWGFFNPLRPELAQRNRVVALDLNPRGIEPPGFAKRLKSQGDASERYSTLTMATHAPTFELFRGLGVTGQWQLRVLVCDADALLAWVGGYRPEPLEARECRLLQALTPALERRLALEEVLRQGPWLRGGLAAALEEVPSAVFIVDESGSVKHANIIGKTHLDRHPAATRKELSAAIGGPGTGEFRRTPIGGVGPRAHWLLVANCNRGPEGRVAAAALRWSLTARQGEVLALLLGGKTNKTIALHLNCAVRTVELHVTSVLCKAGVDSRAALAAKFWQAC